MNDHKRIPFWVSSCTGDIIQTIPVSGGDINDVQKITGKNGTFILKKNKADIQNMFLQEAYGLKKLEEAGLPVPKVIRAEKDGLLLEYYPPGKREAAAAATSLAKLHTQSQSLETIVPNNFIGTIVQINANDNTKSWPLFYVKNRINYARKIYQQKNQPTRKDIRFWDEYEKKVFAFLEDRKNLSYLHGDLWSGNLYYSESGPKFIDPAVYIGDPLVDIAMTKLFGGFTSEFYNSYEKSLHKIAPDLAYHILAKENGKQNNLIQIYQVYPYLIHAILFGNHYYSMAIETAKKSL